MSSTNNYKTFLNVGLLENIVQRKIGEEMFYNLFDNICNLSDTEYLKVLNYIRCSKNPKLSAELIIAHAKQKTLQKYL